MNRFLKGAMILTLAGLIVKVIGALSKVFIARILGGEGIGLYQMAYPIYQIIVAIAASGVPVAISIMIADKLANKDSLLISSLWDSPSYGGLWYGHRPSGSLGHPGLGSGPLYRDYAGLL